MESNKKQKLNYTLIELTDNNLKDKLDNVCCFIEANNNERTNLYNQNNIVDWFKLSTYKDTIKIGNILSNPDLPVFLSIRIDQITNKQICFYCPSGTYSDWDLIDEWITEYFPTKKTDKDITNILKFLERIDHK